MFWLLSMASTLGKKPISKPIKTYQNLLKPFKNLFQIIQNRISTTTTIIIIIPIKCCWNVILSFPVCLVIYSTD